MQRWVRQNELVLAAPYAVYIIGACYSWPMNPTYRNLFSDPPKMGPRHRKNLEGCAEQRKRHQKMAALCGVQFHCAELQTVVGTFTKPSRTFLHVQLSGCVLVPDKGLASSLSIITIYSVTPNHLEPFLFMKQLLLSTKHPCCLGVN